MASWQQLPTSCKLFLAVAMKTYGFETILVVPPKRKEADFDSSHYEQLYKYVAGFSLMTYDFSSLQRPGV